MTESTPIPAGAQARDFPDEPFDYLRDEARPTVPSPGVRVLVVER